MRRLVWSLVIIVALLAILDRVALLSAQHDVAERLQADARLNSAPDVSIHGYPFLTQLVAGDYDDVDIVMHDVDSDDVRIDRLSVHVSGAHVSMGDVLSQDRSRVHVDHATAQLLITYADLGISRSAITRVTVTDGDTIRVTAGDVSGSRTFTGLPFGIRLTSAKATQAGIEVAGEARGLILRT
jgi:hypothetical protein